MTGRNGNVHICLKEHERAFLAWMIEQGRFNSESDALRAGLRLLQEETVQQPLLLLREAIDEGEADLQAGRVREYSDAYALTEAIVATGGVSSNRSG